MRYREIQPSPALARFIECFWTLEDEPFNESAAPERILPDGCVELILNFGGRFREHLDDGTEITQPRHLVVGQMTRPILISAGGRTQLIGIRFRPGGTIPFFRMSMNALTDQVVDLNSLSEKLARELVSSTLDCQELAEKLETVKSFLAKRVSDATASRVLDLAAHVIDRKGQVTIDELSFQAGISSRQLQRRFLQDVGIGPKLLCRILRFQQVFRAMDHSNPGWANVAADCGYYDQAHLIHDFQRFAGQTPSVLLTEASPLTYSFTRKDRMSDFSKTALR